MSTLRNRKRYFNEVTGDQKLGDTGKHVTTVRLVNDEALDVSRGLNTSHIAVHVFGDNPEVKQSAVNIAVGGVMGVPQSAEAVRIKAGGDAADASAGNGARSVTVYGLDSSLNIAEETIACNADGTLASDYTTTTFCRVEKATVTTCGTYNASNTGTMTLEFTTNGDAICIQAGKGISESSLYAVPAGYTGYLERVSVNVDSNKVGDIILYCHVNIDDTKAPYNGRTVVAEWHGISGYESLHYDAYVKIPEKSELYCTGVLASGTGGIDVNYDLVLVKN